MRALNGTHRLSAPVACGLALVVADQVSKLAASSMECGPVICPLRNEALFLGIGAGSGVSALATGLFGLALFLLWIRSARRRGAVPAIAVACVVSGVVANTIDRVMLGSVRDFLAVPGNVVINIADIVDVGGLLVCIAYVARSRLLSTSSSERG
jgi:lipoprotein signal peptidase